MIYETIINYYTVSKNDDNARYKSWEHCHAFFLENRYDIQKIDLMCLHLAFYLASWGMLRGSSFLLQKDYLIHRPVVQILLEQRYLKLWDCDEKSLLDDNIVDLIFELKQRIVNTYQDMTRILNDKQSNGEIASDTLVTKILLGTLGCTPAFDSYFKEGMKIYDLESISFTRRNIKILARMYIDESDFRSAEQEINRNGLTYPPAKLIDMFFWQLGFDRSMTNSKSKNIKNRQLITEPIMSSYSSKKTKRQHGELKTKAINYHGYALDEAI